MERHDGLELRVLHLCQLQLFQQLRIAQGHDRLCFGNNLAQLFGAQQWHGRHRNQAGLHHRQPGQHHADRVAAAQQHPVAGKQAQIVHQDLSDLVYACFGLGITQRQAR